MQIKYKTTKLKKTCTNALEAEKIYGFDMAIKISLRLNQINAANSVGILIQFRIGRCHKLKGTRKNQYSMDLVHPFRLIFRVIEEDKIEIACIEEIVDYH